MFSQFSRLSASDKTVNYINGLLTGVSRRGALVFNIFNMMAQPGEDNTEDTEDGADAGPLRRN